MEWKMPLEEILGLSSEFWKKGGQKTVREAIEDGDIKLDLSYYDKVRARMKETGINQVPIMVTPDRHLGNGHHRTRIAFELDLKEMLVTDNHDESGWSSELEKERQEGIVR